MQRIPEPDLMNEAEQAIAYFQADFSEPHTAFIERLTATFPDLPNTGQALDLGCGPGDITIRFAQAFGQWQVDGVDGASAMLELGWQDLQNRQLQDQVKLHQVYLPSQKAPQSQYDFIFSNSLLHHLQNPLDLWRSLLDLSHSQTPVFIMDLMRPASEAIAAEMVQCYAGSEPKILQTDFFNSLLAAYTLNEVRSQLTQTGLEHLHLDAVSDRHWIVWGYPMAASNPAESRPNA